MIWPNFTMSPPCAIAVRAILWPAATGADSGTPSPSGREPSRGAGGQDRHGVGGVKHERFAGVEHVRFSLAARPAAPWSA